MAAIIEATANLDAIFGRFETVVNKIYERGDVVKDNQIQLKRIQRKFRNIEQLLPQARSFVANNPHAKLSLNEMEDALQVEFARVVAMEEDVTFATIVNRVKRMMEIMSNCEALEDKLLHFLGENVFPIISPNSSLDEYNPANNVPPNPPRLTLDYSTCETDEGKLKATILEQRNARVIAFIASGQGGVGKTCALHGLADDGDIKTTFTGGRLYISLGNDAKQADVINGLADIVCRTGGKQLSGEIKTQETIEEACKLAARWFERQTCLFLVDDVWNLNGIDSSTILSLGEIVHGNSRMVYTSRDKYFCECAEEVIEFKPKAPDGLIARKMLLRHAGFSNNDSQLFNEETASAFNAILEECQGLPLAFGIVGGAIFNMSDEYDEKDKTDVWADYHTDMENCPTMYHVAKMSEKETKLRRIVDHSLQVLSKRNTGRDFSWLFRALCVLEKQQSMPTSVLRKLWNLDSLDEADTIVSAFGEVSLVQVLRQQGRRYIKLHDLVLDLAKHEASTCGEIQRFHNILIKKYASGEENVAEVSHQSTAVATGSKLVVNEQDGKGGRIKGVKKIQAFYKVLVSNLRKGVKMSADNSHASPVAVMESKFDETKHQERKRHMKWWDITADGYIHDNVCKLLHRGGKIDELLWLLSQPEWIVYRSLNGGVLQVDADLNEGITALGKSDSYAKQREHLEIIGKTMRLSRMYVYKNKSEIWFQLYGRLQWHATVNEWTERFIKSIERAASPPWVKAPIGVLQQASLYSQAILETKGIGLCIRIAKDVIWHVWLCGNEIGITSCDVNAENERTVELDMTCFEENGCFQDADASFCAAFSIDGLNVVVVHSSLLIAVFKTETGKLEKQFRLEDRTFAAKEENFRCGLPSSQEWTGSIKEQERVIGISKDGKYVATSNNEYDVQIWSVPNGKTIGPSLRGLTDKVNCMAIDADGKLLVTGGDDDTIRVWNARSGEAIGSPLRGHTGGVGCLTMSADCSQVVSGAFDGSVRIWDIRSGTSLKNPSLSHEDVVRYVSMSEDGTKIVSGSIDGGVIVWEVQDGVMEGEPLCAPTVGIYCVEISRNGDIAASFSIDRTVRVWNTKRNKGMGQNAVQKEKRYGEGVMTADGRRYVLKTGKYTANVVDAKSGEAVGVPIQIDIESIQCVGVSANDKRGVFGFQDGTLIVFDMMSGEKIREPLRGHEHLVSSVAISADGEVIASASYDKTVTLWGTQSDAHAGKPFVGHSDVVDCVALSADGSKVVSGAADNTVRVWDAQNGKPIGLPLLGHDGSINCVGLSADAKKAASGSYDGTVRVWDVESSQQVGGPFHHESPVFCFGFDANLSSIATICLGGVQKLWDVESGSCGPTLPSQQWNSELNCLSLSWNGRFNDNGEITIIDVDEKGTETVLATTDVDLFNGPGFDIYFSHYSEPLILLR